MLICHFVVETTQLSDFNGRSLSSFNSSSLVNEPDTPEAGELRAWFDSAGGGSSFNSVSVRSGGGGGDGKWKVVTFGSRGERGGV